MKQNAYTDKQGTQHSEQELLDIVEAHRQWLDGDTNGLQADFSDCVFHRLKTEPLCAVDLRRAIFSRASLVGLNMNSSNLRETNFEGATLEGVSLEETDFTKANMKNARIEGALADYNTLFVCTDLTGATIIECKLNNCDFSNCILDDTCITDTKITDSKLVGISLKNADLRYADIENSDLHEVDFTQIQYADDVGIYILEKCDLRGANFMGVNMKRIHTNKSVFV